MSLGSSAAEPRGCIDVVYVDVAEAPFVKEAQTVLSVCVPLSRSKPIPASRLHHVRGDTPTPYHVVAGEKGLRFGVAACSCDLEVCCGFRVALWQATETTVAK